MNQVCKRDRGDVLWWGRGLTDNGYHKLSVTYQTCCANYKIALHCSVTINGADVVEHISTCQPVDRSHQKALPMLPECNCNPNRKNNRLEHSTATSLAAFIAGCLVFEHIIVIDEKKLVDDKDDKISDAIRVISACISQSAALPPETDYPVLPFEW